MNKYFLKKRDNEFWLESRSENHCTVIAEQEPNVNDLTSKLSIKNCQAIERGWDLDELVEQEFSKFDQEVRIIYRRQLQESLANMFKKALEILGDKKFSEEDMSKAWSEGYHRKVDELNGNGLRYFDKFIQLLQPTEWEVEIIMKNSRTGKVINSESDLSWNEDGLCDEAVPLLDENGCLILKKK